MKPNQTKPNQKEIKISALNLLVLLSIASFVGSLVRSIIFRIYLKSIIA